MRKEINKQAILDYLERHGGGTIKDISKETGLSRNQIYKAMKELESEGKVRRFKSSFVTSRKYGQLRVFGFRSKFFYYSNKDKFLKWLANKIKIDLPVWAKLSIFNRKLSKEDRAKLRQYLLQES